MAHPTVQIPTITVGTRLTDFASLDLTVEGLAAGGMGLVVWGKNAAEGNHVRALKLLKPERVAAAAHSPQQRRAIERQFEDEALVWCHLWPHQCVVTATGLTRLVALGDLPVLSLTYAPQGSLRDVLRQGRQQRTHPPLRAALAWAVHIASALAHIHQPDSAHDRDAPLVHCDLKPENVLLDAQGWAQLTDLGLTRAYAALAADIVEASEETPAAAAPVDANTLTPHQAEVVRLRAILQAAGALPSEAEPRAAGSPEQPALFATRTLRIPPTHVLPDSAGLSAAAPTLGAISGPVASAAIGSRGPVAGSPPYMAPEQWEGLDAVVPATDLYAFGVLLYELFAGTESPYPFPVDPTPYLTPALAAHALAIGYDPLLLAWHAAHMAASGPAHRLTDPDVAVAAFRSGPLADLANHGDLAGRQAAETALRQLDALIGACLTSDAGARPIAAFMQQQLAALVSDPCDLEPLPIPVPLPAEPHNEAAFWGNLGMTYSRLGRQQEAIAVKRRAIQHDRSDPVNWINLGNSLDEVGQEEREQAAKAKAAGRPEQEVAALLTAAQQHFEEALAALQQAEDHVTADTLAEFPMLPHVLANNQGKTLAHLVRYPEAIAAYQRALALRPDKHDTRFNLALDYAHWSQVPDATPAERLERLQAAQREVQAMLAAAPHMSDGRRLAEHIARALADPQHRFVG